MKKNINLADDNGIFGNKGIKNVQLWESEHNLEHILIEGIFQTI